MSAEDGSPRLRNLIRPRGTRGEIAAAILLLLLGYGTVVQFKAHANAGLESLRQTDLVKILADVTARTNQLQEEKVSLESLKFQLTSGAGSSRAALESVRQHIDALRILSGQAAAHGPGLELTIYDFNSSLTSNIIVGLINELRDAGAEVLAISGSDGTGAKLQSRIVASTYFQSDGKSLNVGGKRLYGPYLIEAIGDGATMATALRIAGGSLDQLHQIRAQTLVQVKGDVKILSLAPVEPNRYARNITKP